MLLKSADIKDADIAILNNLLNHRSIPDDKKQLISRELQNVTKGIKTENEAAYLLDFHFGPSKNMMVLHDLRLELNGRVAQIDHILINRLCEVYVLETKSFSSGLLINELGEFSTTFDGRKVGIPSPIEQNERHITVLRDAFKQIGLPKRLGINIPPSFHPVILVSQNAVIERPNSKKLLMDNVIKLDQFMSWHKKRIDKTNASDALVLLKVCSANTVMELGKKLAALHQPMRIDYVRKFDLASALTNRAPISQIKVEEKPPFPPATAQPDAGKSYFCTECQSKIASVVAKFCWNNKIRFNGRIYCRVCQTKF
jgi:hypothetical protein